MARWLIAQGDHQFSARDLAELKKLAAEGTLGAHDMIQPPGSTEWMYASELPELDGLLRPGSGAADVDDDLDYRPRRNTAPIVVVLLLVAVAAGWFAWQNFQKIPDTAQLELLGEGGLGLTEVLVTDAGASLLSEPGGSAIGALQKDTKLKLLGKRNDWYQVRTPDGREGFVRIDQVIPGYYFADKRTREKYDPLFNPDAYVFVKNSAWMRIDPRQENLTVFQFFLENTSMFPMTDLVLLATVKDEQGNVVEKVEIPVEGIIPPNSGTFVGTLQPEKRNGKRRLLTAYTFSQMAEEDPDLQLRWSDGVEVEMKSQGYSEATIDLLQLRAIAPDDLLPS